VNLNYELHCHRQVVQKISVVWNMMPCILVGRLRLLEEPALSIFKRHPYNLKMELAGSFKTFVPLNQAAQHHVPEDSTFSSRHSTNQISQMT
jgi:hypothetical protein